MTTAPTDSVKPPPGSPERLEAAYRELDEIRSKASSREQVLTVMLLRAWYLVGDGSYVYVDGGLTVEEARKKGLEPLIGARLSTCRLPIWLLWIEPLSKGIDLGAMLRSAWKHDSGEFADAFHGQPGKLHVDIALTASLPHLVAKLSAAGIEVITDKSNRLVSASKRELQALDVGYEARKRYNFFSEDVLLRVLQNRSRQCQAWLHGPMKPTHTGHGVIQT